MSDAAANDVSMSMSADLSPPAAIVEVPPTRSLERGRYVASGYDHTTNCSQHIHLSHHSFDQRIPPTISAIQYTSNNLKKSYRLCCAWVALEK
jgi:hypothetical protein